MSWWETLDKIKLAEILNSLEIVQAGKVNINIGEINVNLNMDQETTTKLQQFNVTPEIEEQIKDTVRKQLGPISRILEVLPDSVSDQTTVGTVTVSASDYIKDSDK